MMLKELFFYGMLGGGTLAIPIGANGMLALKYSLEGMFKKSCRLGIGVSISTFLVAFLSLCLFLSIGRLETSTVDVIGKIAGGILLSFGIIILIRNLRQRNNELKAKPAPPGYREFFTGLLLGALNPKKLSGFPFIIVGVVELSENFNLIQPLVFSLGAFTGNIIWWAVILFLYQKIDSKKSVALLKYAKWFLVFLFSILGIQLLLS